jgi:hypothetical protein
MVVVISKKRCGCCTHLSKQDDYNEDHQDDVTIYQENRVDHISHLT